jgi:hypothetical protein
MTLPGCSGVELLPLEEVRVYAAALSDDAEVSSKQRIHHHHEKGLEGQTARGHVTAKHQSKRSKY